MSTPPKDCPSAVKPRSGVASGVGVVWCAEVGNTEEKIRASWLEGIVAVVMMDLALLSFGWKLYVILSLELSDVQI